MKEHFYKEDFKFVDYIPRLKRIALLSIKVLQDEYKNLSAEDVYNLCTQHYSYFNFDKRDCLKCPIYKYRKQDMPPHIVVDIFNKLEKKMSDEDLRKQF